MDRSRRSILLAAGTVLGSGIGLCGCISDGRGSADTPAEDSNDPSMVASFFTLYDFTRNIGGSDVSVQNAVPVGQHGHGWEPQADILPTIAESDVFVYAGIPGFQRWVDSTVETLQTGYDVTLVDAVEGVELRSIDDDHDHEHGSDDHDGDPNERDHSGGNDESHDVDPHFWLDPIAAGRSVESIRDGIAETRSEIADRLKRNTSTYLTDLDELHGRFESALADRTHDGVVVAGHNSYRYLAARYGFDIHTPTGVSPNSEANYRDIEETIRLIEERNIEHVLYDRFEGDTLARQIANEVDADVEIIMVSSAESTDDEWNDRGWGYIEQMTRINLPAFRTALGAD